jgi:transposase
MLEATWQPIGIDDNVVGAADVRELEQRVRELEQVAGTRTAEVEALRKALAIALEKNAALQRFVWAGARSSPWS